MNEYWRINPPLHKLVAMYMQYKPAEKKAEAGNIDDFVRAMGGVNV